METGTAAGERQFRFAQRQIFQSLTIVEVRHTVQGELLGSERMVKSRFLPVIAE